MSRAPRRSSSEGPRKRTPKKAPRRQALPQEQEPRATRVRSASARGKVPWVRVLLAMFVAGVLGAAGVSFLVFRGGPSELSWVEKWRAWWPGNRVEVTLPEGLTVFQVAERLDRAEICPRAAFLQVATDPVVLQDLGIQAPSAEGYLFPAKYEFSREMRAELVLARLVREAKKRWARFPVSSSPLPFVRALSEYELITLASIVEKETAVPAERPRVAQVFLNRLMQPEGETRGRLQSDPTAVYGCFVLPEEIPSCQQFTGGVTPELLRDAQNPYNTYRLVGLPPGPIATPGEASVRAVLQPAGGDELYFFSDGAGRHTFSKTYEEHLQAISRRKSGAPPAEEALKEAESELWDQ